MICERMSVVSEHFAKRDDQCDTRDSGSDVQVVARPVVCAHKRKIDSQRRVSPGFFLLLLTVPPSAGGTKNSLDERNPAETCQVILPSAMDVFKQVTNVDWPHRYICTEHDHITEEHEFMRIAFTCLLFAVISTSDVATFVCDDHILTVPKTTMCTLAASRLRQQPRGPSIASLRNDQFRRCGFMMVDVTLDTEHDRIKNYGIKKIQLFSFICRSKSIQQFHG